MQLSYTQIIKFLVAGGLGIILYYIVFYSLTEWAEVWYVTSSIIAFILNTCLNFILKKFWVFQNKDGHAFSRQLINYWFLAGTILAVNTMGLYALVEYAHVWYLLAQVILTVILTVGSYLISRRIFQAQNS